MEFYFATTAFTTLALCLGAGHSILSQCHRVKRAWASPGLYAKIGLFSYSLVKIGSAALALESTSPIWAAFGHYAASMIVDLCGMLVAAEWFLLLHDWEGPGHNEQLGLWITSMLICFFVFLLLVIDPASYLRDRSDFSLLARRGCWWIALMLSSGYLVRACWWPRSDQHVMMAGFNLWCLLTALIPEEHPIVQLLVEVSRLILVLGF